MQHQALQIIQAGLGSGSMMACLKAWLRAGGIPAGYARRPFTNFTEAEEQQLKQTFLQLDEQQQIGLKLAEGMRQA